MSLLRDVLFGCLLLIATGVAVADPEEDDYVVQRWQEEAVHLPAAPQSENLLPFYVSATTTNKFFVDASSISVGNDGVVRYTLVVLAAEGGRNVSYEGMRCETRERRIYAAGRSDGSWSTSRNHQWSPIQDAAANRHYAALFLEYFCVGGAIVRNADEARGILKRGGIPSTKVW